MQDHYLITVKPQSELLKKVVAYFYFHVSKDKNHSESFHFYPNYLHALTIYKGNNVAFGSDFSSKITPSTDIDQLTFIYTVNDSEKFHVTMNGAFFKIGIVFYPLGINHFITAPLNNLMPTKFQEIEMATNFKQIIATINLDLSIANQTALLEKALLSAYQPYNEPRLKQAIKEIVLSNGTIKIEELEKSTQVNRKTLLRLFKKHTLTTIEAYKKMVMFRNSLNYAVRQKELVNLTDVALYNMYYDQSHFIKHFKTVTNEAPKTLLPKITQIGNEDLYWYFTKN